MLVYDPGSLEEAQRGFTLADILKKWPEFLEWEHRVVTGYQVAAAMEFLHAQAPPLFCAVWVPLVQGVGRITSNKGMTPSACLSTQAA